MKRTKLTILLVLLVILLSACVLPFQIVPQTTQEAPNLTLTALFDTSLHIPPTITPPVVNTPEATVMATAAVPNTAVATTVVPTTAVPTTAPTTAAPTTAPTNTPYVIVVTATKVPPTPTKVPKQRPGTQMSAGYLDYDPAMDGSYETWLDETTKYKLPYTVWGSDKWSGQDDLEGAFAAAWNEDYLYIAVKVTDDKYVQNQTGNMMYKGDSIEILIDSDLMGDFYVDSLDYDDFQLGVSAGTKSTNITENYLWYPKGYAGSKSKIKMASLFESGPVYRIEVGIPWSMLGIDPYKGMRIGFAVSINDNDDSSNNVQQSMISTAAQRNFLDPTTWGELILEW